MTIMCFFQARIIVSSADEARRDSKFGLAEKALQYFQNLYSPSDKIEQFIDQLLEKVIRDFELWSHSAVCVTSYQSW